jgi:hypothetical protein
MCYIQGGKPQDADKIFPGCSDKAQPLADKQIQIDHALYFAKSSNIWEGGGVAFIKAKRNRNNKIRTLGRMYLVTAEQFTQIVRQENAKEPEDNSIRIDLEKTIKNGRSMINGNWYSRILHLGDDDGYPIFTFTGSWSDAKIEPRPPSEKYMNTIIKGIRETYELESDCILRYLVGVDGIRGLIDTELLKKWIRDVE